MSESESEKEICAGGAAQVGAAERVELRLRDAFGNIHIVEALSREELKERIYDLGVEEIVKKAYEEHIQGFARGRCEIDIRTGEVGGGSYIGNSDDIFAPYVILYSIPENLDPPYEDLLDDEECVKLREEYEGDFRGMVEKERIDIDERIVEALLSYDDAPFTVEWKRWIDEQIDEMYESAEDP